jgi:hypothetical protein
MASPPEALAVELLAAAKAVDEVREEGRTAKDNRVKA